MKNIIAVLMILLAGCVPQAGPNYSTAEGPVHWDTTPVYVYVDDSLPEHSRVGVREAVRDWNDALGADVFQLNIVPETSVSLMLAPEGSITVSQGELGTRLEETGEEELSDFIAVTVLGIADLSWYRTSRMHSCMILLDYEVDSVTARPVAAHELGHCLGLRHSADKESIMFHFAAHSPEQYITLEDVEHARRALP